MSGSIIAEGVSLEDLSDDPRVYTIIILVVILTAVVQKYSQRLSFVPYVNSFI
jgi:hypothetical protein